MYVRHVHSGACGDQRRASVPLQLELHVVVEFGRNSGLLQEQPVLLTSEPTLSTLSFFCILFLSLRTFPLLLILLSVSCWTLFIISREFKQASPVTSPLTLSHRCSVFTLLSFKMRFQRSLQHSGFLPFSLVCIGLCSVRGPWPPHTQTRGCLRMAEEYSVCFGPVLFAAAEYHGPGNFLST